MTAEIYDVLARANRSRSVVDDLVGYLGVLASDEIMLCPWCSKHINENWQYLYAGNDAWGKSLGNYQAILPEPDFELFKLSLSFMGCPNAECRRLIIRATMNVERVKDQGLTWYVWPMRRVSRPIDHSVPPEFAEDYKEANAILEDSPRMSTVLSRSILADLLERYAGLSQFRTTDRIDKFIEDPKHPPNLKDNLHYLREIADLSAHTKTDRLGQRIKVTKEEAEWTLDVIDGLFDYFIIGPAKDAERRRAIAEKIEEAGRKPPRDDGEYLVRVGNGAEFLLEYPLEVRRT